VHDLSLVFIDILLLGGDEIEKFNVKLIVGEKFEDLSLAEMTLVQGAGDVQHETLIPSIATLVTTIFYTKGIK
jgi:type 2 lantibiotic (TIGR03893 family)